MASDISELIVEASISVPSVSIIRHKFLTLIDYTKLKEELIN